MTTEELPMVAQEEARQTMTVDEWREMERTSHDIKYEYIDGQVYAMSGGSLDHAGIAGNLLSALNSAFGDGPCIAYNSDAAARLSSKRYTVPDVTVTCDEHDRGPTMEVQSPRLVVEVLSDSTEAYDRGQKSGFYRACPLIQEYVLIATKYQAVEVYRRTVQGWILHEYGPSDTVELESIGVRVPVDAVYRRTQVPLPGNPQGEV